MSEYSEATVSRPGVGGGVGNKIRRLRARPLGTALAWRGVLHKRGLWLPARSIEDQHGRILVLDGKQRHGNSSARCPG